MEPPVVDTIRSVRDVNFSRWTDEASLIILRELDREYSSNLSEAVTQRSINATDNGDKFAPVSAEDSKFSVVIDPLGSDSEIFRFESRENYNAAMSVINSPTIASLDPGRDTLIFEWATGSGIERTRQKFTLVETGATKTGPTSGTDDATLPDDPSVGVLDREGGEFGGADGVTQLEGSTETQPVVDGEVVDTMDSDTSGGDFKAGSVGVALAAIAIAAYAYTRRDSL